MKVASTMARKTLLAAVASLGLAAAVPQAFADSPSEYPGYGMGPGMMGGYGPGYGMGPGMMGGYGMGPGMMGGYGPGYGMGPGMMGGYGPGYGMGPGMMGGYGPGYGMGPGMMGGYGGYGMGPGMMGGYGPGGCGGYGYGWEGVKLTDAQRGQIDKILEDSARQRWELMGKMREQGWKMHQLYASGKADDAALKQAYDTMSAMRKSMFENNLETRKKIDAVLTKEQREQLRGG